MNDSIRLANASLFFFFIYASLELLAKDPKDKDKLERINGMVAMAYAEGFDKAIDELE